MSRRSSTLPTGIDQLSSGKYRARVWGSDRRQHSLGSFATVEGARRALADARVIGAVDGVNGRRVERSGQGRTEISLDRWMAQWMPTRDIREPTLLKDWERYRLHIKPYLGDLPLSGLTVFEVQRWLAHLKTDGRRDPTRKKAHALLKTALGVHGAIGDERIKSNPCVIAQAPKVQRRDWNLLTRDQFWEIQDRMPAGYQPLTHLAAFGGLRWSEIVGLQRKHIDVLRKTVRVERAITYRAGVFYIDVPKNRRSRIVPLPMHAVDALRSHIGTLDPSPDTPVFSSPRGHQLRPHFGFRVWKPAVRAAGYPEVRFHDLRHSCASWLLAGGATLAQVRDILGHSSIAVTELYLHTDIEELLTAVQAALG